MDIKSSNSTLIQAQNQIGKKPNKSIGVRDKISDRRMADIDNRNAALSGKTTALKAKTIIDQKKPKKLEKSSSAESMQAALDKVRNSDSGKMFSREAPMIGSNGGKPKFQKLGQIVDIRV